MAQDIISGTHGFRNFVDRRVSLLAQATDEELTDILAALPTAAQSDVGALTATAIAAAVPSAAPAGGTGAEAGAYDTAENRDAMIATVNGLRTHAIEMDLDYEALLVDVAAIRTTLNALLAKLRTAGIVTP
jgi:hypothetical protein